jgi:3-oxoacyl-[acyl-carrier protein] reductase
MALSGRLDGKVALITGAARRIGRASAIELAREGAHVVIHAKSSSDEIETVAKEIRDLGGSASTALADITDEPSVKRLIDGIVDAYGGLHIVVNNAAIRNETPFEKITLDDWRAVNSVVTGGAFLVTRAAIPHLVKAKWGRIIAIGGVAGHSGVFERVHVATAKASLIGFTKAIAVEYAQHGVTANLVVPGKIGGPRSATSGKGGAFPNNAQPIVTQEGLPEDVAEIVRSLAISGFVSGQTVHVNGGMYLP